MANVYKCCMSELAYFEILADDDEQTMEWMATHTIDDVRKMTKPEMSYSEEILHIEGRKTTADIDISSEGRAKQCKYRVTGGGLPEELIISVGEIREMYPQIDPQEDPENWILDYLSDKYGYDAEELAGGDNKITWEVIE